MSRRKSPVATWLVDLLYFAVGSVLYGMSVNMFTAPNQIAPGGLTGLSTLINYVFGTPIGTVIFIMNLPLFAWAFLAIGYRFRLGDEVIERLIAPFRRVRAAVCRLAGKQRAKEVIRVAGRGGPAHQRRLVFTILNPL